MLIFLFFSYTTVVPIMLPHKTMCDTEVAGHPLPANTEVWVNSWGQNHDESVWGDPYVFRPDRFLDDEGDLVLADHPNRVNMVPFGAGSRACVGETFAMSRMFLIIAMFMQRFQVLPASTVTEQPSCDARDMILGIVLSPPEYMIRLKERHN